MTQANLFAGSDSAESPRKANGSRNKLLAKDRAFHDWYRFVLSYPPHLVRDYLADFQVGAGQCVLDPFCGTGTTLVECSKRGIASVGIEPNPMACLASQVKTDWDFDPDALMRHARHVAEAAEKELRGGGLTDGIDVFRPAGDVKPKSLRRLSEAAEKLLLKGSISPVPLHKSLVLLDHIRAQADVSHVRHELLALAGALVNDVGNLHFGPEVGVGKPRHDAPVIGSWYQRVFRMAEDVRQFGRKRRVRTRVVEHDARCLPQVLSPASIDAVITSPPYPNEKDYTRTTRLESVILGLLKDKSDLRKLKSGLIRSNTRNVFKADQDDRWISPDSEVARIARQIEARRIEMGKTSGFERLYHRVTRLYFGGMAKHLADLREVLRPGARLAYVVGDQASYLRIMIRTGRLLADLAVSLGYELIRVDLFRTRLATATREQLREEVVVLRWPG